MPTSPSAVSDTELRQRDTSNELLSDVLARDWSGLPRVGDTRLGILGLIAAGASLLRDAEQLPVVPAWLASALRETVGSLPPQYALGTVPAHLAAWLDVGAVSERMGGYELADFLVSCLAVHALAIPDTAMRAEMRALCAARRGRIARQMGAMTRAADFYDDAVASTRGRVSPDAWPQAVLGLAVAANMRGNLPEAVRACRRVLNRRSRVADLYRLSAHQMLVTIHRKRGDFGLAFEHAWSAFAHLRLGDERALELLVVMSDMSLAVGCAREALQGYTFALRHADVERIRIPAASGAARAAVREALTGGATQVALDDLKPGARTDAVQALARLNKEIDAATQPHERVKARLCVAELALVLGLRGEARRALNAVTNELESARFHEFEAQAETLWRALNAENAPTARTRVIASVIGETALQRRGAYRDVRVARGIERLARVGTLPLAMVE